VKLVTLLNHNLVFILSSGMLNLTPINTQH
jgi:hypothetical protein